MANSRLYEDWRRRFVGRWSSLLVMRMTTTIAATLASTARRGSDRQLAMPELSSI
jgi:hypothetical protein